MADYTLSAKITGDSSGFEKAFSRAQRTLDSFQARTESFAKKLDGIGDSFTKLGTKMTIGLTAPLLVAGKKMFSAASDYNENLNKISVAFGDNADAVKAWSETATKQFGLSKNQALEATALFGDMATSMGVVGNDASNMSTSLAGLAGDLASFKNIDIDQAMTALSGVFTGETESLKRLGVVMTQTNLEAFALSKGIKKNIDDMTQAEKVQLRYAYVMEMTKNAHGDYANTADGTANSLRTFQSSVDNLAIAFGQHLLPTITPLIQQGTQLINTFAALPPETQQTIVKIGAFTAAAGPAVTMLGKFTSGTAGFISGMGKFSGVLVKLTDVKSGFDGINKSIKGLKSGITTFSNIKEVMLIPFEDLAKKFPTVSGAVSTAWSATGGKLIGIAKTATSIVLSKFGTLTSGIKTRLAPALDYMGTWGSMAAEAFSPLLSKIASFAPMLINGMNIAAGAGLFLAGLGILYQMFGEEINKFLLTARTKGPEIVTNLCNGIVSKIPDLILNGTAMVNSLMNTIIANLPAIIKGGVDIVTSLISGIGQQLPVLIPTAVELVITLVTGLLDNLPAIIDSGIKLLEGLVDGLIRSIPKLVAAVPRIITSLATTIISKAPQILEAGVRLIVALGTGLVQAIPQLVGQVPSIVSSLWNAFTSVNWWDVGKNIISGIANGLRSSAGILWDAAMNAASRALEKAKSFLGIHSPSTVFRDEVGKMMAMGMGIGFEGNVPVQMMVSGIDDAVKTIEAQSSTLMLRSDVADTQSIGVPSVMGYAVGSAERTYKADSGYINSLDGVVIQVINNTSVDGTPLKETVSDYTIKKIGNQQKAVMRARGGYAY